jgi:mannosyl-3-phosphoglycerate phosphatase
MALGDAPNDIAMLEAADTGVIVANPHGAGIAKLPGESAGWIRRTALPGPDGWNEAVLDMIEHMAAVRPA